VVVLDIPAVVVAVVGTVPPVAPACTLTDPACCWTHGFVVELSGPGLLVYLTQSAPVNRSPMFKPENSVMSVLWETGSSAVPV